MTSLAEVYEGQVGESASLRRLYLGVGLFLLGALLVVSGIVVAATDIAIGALGMTKAREYGGILGGLGIPAVFLGILTVLPADRRTRAAAVVGAGIAVLGVALFTQAYPCNWSGSNCGPAYLTLPTITVYFLGTITTFWCLFVGVANFKSRNDPGGTVRLQLTREGETEIIEVPRSQLSEVEGGKGAMGQFGGVGFLGNTPDGNVETQTNTDDTQRARASDRTSAADRNSPTKRNSMTATDTTASDGGASTQDIRSLRDGPSGSSVSPQSSSSTPSPESPSAASRNASSSGASGGRTTNAGDAYCGSCGHFQYVRTENGMQPYCGLHDDLMDDMDACEEWNPR